MSQALHFRNRRHIISRAKNGTPGDENIRPGV
jgi:hypothetical protein